MSEAQAEYAATGDKIFDDAIRKTLAWEGGYVDDPDDPGGETKYGLSKKSYPGLDIQNIVLDTAVAIYRRDYWLWPRINEIADAKVAAKTFDLAVLCGPRRAVLMLQEASRKESGRHLEVDGILGERTLSAVNQSENPAHLLAELKLQAVAYFAGLNRAKYIHGWIRRVLA